ncbi:MAG: PDZ domain-containing protein [Planctomycetota bacterium]|nr:PDZ domain-containing protein [Planctomycetota bacterium]
MRIARRRQVGIAWSGFVAPALGPVAALCLLAPAAWAQGGGGRGAGTPAAIDAAPPELRQEIDRARDRVFPALVNIQVVSVSYWGGKEQKGASTGSGTIISRDGLIVTNQHVTDDGRTFRVTLSDKREVTATLVGEDRMTDLAVLRVDVADLKGTPLPGVAEWGNSDELKVGDYVMAMGAPYGLSRSVTLGIVSNTERVFASLSGDDIADQEFDFDTSSDVFTRWIQHDALILPGNSGGPLVNLRGEIVGVNTRGGSGLGFANPSNFARQVAQEIIEKGRVTRSSIGAAFKSVRRAGYDEGVLLNSVDADGAAAKAGLKAGDVLLTMDGKPLNARFAEEIPLVLRAIAEKPVGTPVEFTYRRGEETGTVSVTTEELLRERGDETALRLFGISVAEVTPRMVRARRLTDGKGAMVLGVRGGGPAENAEPAMQRGDVIRSVNGTPIDTLRDLVDLYREMAKQDPLPEFVTVEFDRAGKNNLTLLEPRPDKREDPPRELPKAWIGVATQPVLRDLAKQIGLGDTTGFRVTRVYPGTVAAEAGLKVGDVITSLNGDRLNPRSIQDSGMFQRQVRRMSSGQEVALGVIRGTQTLDLKMTLERTRLAPEEALRDENRDFELSVRELTFFDRDDNRWEDSVQGVLVENVERAGWAGLAGLFPGDLIQRIDSMPVTDIASYRKAMEDVSERQPERVTIVVLRGLRTQFMFAEPEWKPVIQTETGAEKE